MEKTLLVLLMCASLAGCGGSSSSGPNLSGNWQFTANSTAFGLTVTGSGTFRQSGSSVTGSVTLSGTPCATTAAVTGSISGATVTLQLQEGTQPVNFTGTVNSSLNSISGTYTAPSGGCTNGDFGTWSATRTG
jgi:hypothetical protein